MLLVFVLLFRKGVGRALGRGLVMNVFCSFQMTLKAIEYSDSRGACSRTEKRTTDQLLKKADIEGKEQEEPAEETEGGTRGWEVKQKNLGDFPGILVVKALSSQYRGHWFNPWLGH